MTPDPKEQRASTPCEGIRADLSAMLDGELADARARRVLVHLEVCEGCRSFMEQLRRQVLLHRSAVDREEGLFWSDLEDELAADLAELDGGPDAEELAAEMLARGRENLAEVFYQIGRSYVLLAVHPEFFRLLAREPVPIPESRLRGRAVFDGLAGGRPVPRGVEGRPEAATWLEARHLLHGEFDDRAGVHEKGRSFLRLALSLRREPKALLMLGESYYQQAELAPARRCYLEALRLCPAEGGPVDPVSRVPLRIFAEEHLGNLCLAEGEPKAALAWFERVEASGAMRIHPNFSSAYGNLAYTHALLGNLERAADYLERLYADFPAHRRAYGQMIVLKPNLHKKLCSDPEILARLARSCPAWFGEGAELLRHGAALRFDFMAPQGGPGAGHLGEGAA